MKKEFKSLIIGMILVSCFLFTGCCIKRIALEPNVAYLEQRGMRIFICRMDSTGGTVCEATLEFYGDNKLLVTPMKNWSINGR